MEDVRFTLTGCDGGLAAEMEWGCCPVCGALLDSAEDMIFLYREREKGRENAPGRRGREAPAWPPQAAGCSRCLARWRAEEWSYYTQGAG